MRPYRETHDGLGELLALAVRGGHQAADLERIQALHARLVDEEVFESASLNKVTHAVGDALSRALGTSLSALWRDTLDANESRVESLLDLTVELNLNDVPDHLAEERLNDRRGHRDFLLSEVRL